MSTLISEATARGTRRCDARCYNACGPVCRCCCGGKLHGIGLAAAAIKLKEHFGISVSIQADLPWGENHADD